MAEVNQATTLATVLYVFSEWKDMAEQLQDSGYAFYKTVEVSGMSVKEVRELGQIAKKLLPDFVTVSIHLGIEDSDIGYKLIAECSNE